MEKNYLFTSERLGFRNWKEADISKMIRISGDPKVMEYFPAPATPQQTEEFIRRMQAEYEENGFCYFAVDVLETEEFIGFTGLMNQNYEVEFSPCIDIGWRLSVTAWGKGYATEGAKRCLEFAFEELKLTELVSTAPQVNLKSINVMQKIGMKKELDFRHPRLKGIKRLENCVCYKMTNPLKN